MKKLLLACVCMPLFLAACSGPRDVKLSEMNEPDNAKALLEELTPEERNLLAMYVVNHSIAQNLDYKMTVKEAIATRRKEIDKEKQKN